MDAAGIRPARRRLLALAGALLAGLALSPFGGRAGAADLDPENVLLLELKDGKVLIELLPKVAPKHVAQIKALVRAGFYDGLTFHRVIEGFMAQTGDPTGSGGGGSDLPDIKAEFSALPFERGSVGMARTPDPDSANSQWFICFARASNLDGQYTIWGRVIEGMEAVDRIKKGERARNGVVRNPDRIVSLKVLADVR